MTEKQFEDLKKDLRNYRKKKVEINDQIKQVKQKAKEGKILSIDEDQLTNELWKELIRSPERTRVVSHANRTKNDDDFEKGFRAAHSEVFWGKPLDRTKL